ncbi:hypothetical protein C4K35_4156 [Pseudomonas chlororaphis subsp. piscium]|uniref:hypothetical protein n=1 Tax=Pseudomonas chlororaphis TaxID=587753 RepID=UPI000F586A6D|nr:hypothetical protein [Pseudomonas chlororaphis]AZC51735.1 hypothetical protein C4K35_4156 [Pseudomonas chlororaphis subsp. piscium]
MRFPHLDQATRGLRGRAFCHAAAAMAGRPHTHNSMAAWYLQGHPNLHSDVRKQWRRAFEGATIASWVRDDLSKRYPALRQVFHNPLWALISESADAMDWDALADTIQVANQPLDGPLGRLTTLLSDRVDWPCFCVHLVMLRTHHCRFRIYRQWLANNFVRIFGWVSVQSPLVFIANEVHRQLSPLVLDEHLSPATVTSWAKWPEIHQLNLELIERCSQAHWLSAHDQQLALWWWNLSAAQCSSAVNQLYEDNQEGGQPEEMSTTLQQVWRRKRHRWLDHPIVLNGFDCGFPQVGGLERLDKIVGWGGSPASQVILRVLHAGFMPLVER